jgi:hypothetical protein
LVSLLPVHMLSVNHSFIHSFIQHSSILSLFISPSPRTLFPTITQQVTSIIDDTKRRMRGMRPPTALELTLYDKCSDLDSLRLSIKTCTDDQLKQVAIQLDRRVVDIQAKWKKKPFDKKAEWWKQHPSVQATQHPQLAPTTRTFYLERRREALRSVAEEASLESVNNATSPQLPSSLSSSCSPNLSPFSSSSSSSSSLLSTAPLAQPVPSSNTPDSAYHAQVMSRIDNIERLIQDIMARQSRASPIQPAMVPRSTSVVAPVEDGPIDTAASDEDDILDAESPGFWPAVMTNSPSLPPPDAVVAVVAVVKGDQRDTHSAPAIETYPSASTVSATIYSSSVLDAAAVLSSSSHTAATHGKRKLVEPVVRSTKKAKITCNSPSPPRASSTPQRKSTRRVKPTATVSAPTCGTTATVDDDVDVALSTQPSILTSSPSTSTALPIITTAPPASTTDARSQQNMERQQEPLDEVQRGQTVIQTEAAERQQTQHDVDHQTASMLLDHQLRANEAARADVETHRMNASEHNERIDLFAASSSPVLALTVDVSASASASTSASSTTTIVDVVVGTPSNMLVPLPSRVLGHFLLRLYPGTLWKAWLDNAVADERGYLAMMHVLVALQNSEVIPSRIALARGRSSKKPWEQKQLRVVHHNCLGLGIKSFSYLTADNLERATGAWVRNKLEWVGNSCSTFEVLTSMALTLVGSEAAALVGEPLSDDEWCARCLDHPKKPGCVKDGCGWDDVNAGEHRALYKMARRTLLVLGAEVVQPMVLSLLELMDHHPQPNFSDVELTSSLPNPFRELGELSSMDLLNGDVVHRLEQEWDTVLDGLSLCRWSQEYKEMLSEQKQTLVVVNYLFREARITVKRLMSRMVPYIAFPRVQLLRAAVTSHVDRVREKTVADEVPMDGDHGDEESAAAVNETGGGVGADMDINGGGQY